MAIQRLRMLQAKSTAIAKQQRRVMAELLGVAKVESARIRVESIIRSDIATELHEILELYCELLLARIQLLEGPVVVPGLPNKDGVVEEPSADANILDPGLDEAIRSVLYAAPRTDIKELSQARALLVEKFGKDYALLAAEGNGVPERVLKRVRVETPKPELVDAYLREIGRTYGVRFPGETDTDDDDEDGGLGEAEELQDNDAGDDGDGGGGAKIKALEAPLEAEDLARATPPRDLGETRSPLRIAPPSPSTENPGPKVKLPGGGAAKSKKASTSSGTAKAGAAPKAAPTASGKAKDKGDGPGGNIPDVDELAKRFAALKRG